MFKIVTSFTHLYEQKKCTFQAMFVLNDFVILFLFFQTDFHITKVWNSSSTIHDHCQNRIVIFITKKKGIGVLEVIKFIFLLSDL